MIMMTVNGYRILKEDLGSDIHRLRKELTVSPKVSDIVKQKPIFYDVYRENEKYIYIPRWYGIQTYGKVNDDRMSSVYQESQLKFEGELREETNQPEASKNICEKLKTHGCCLLSLPTGYGKTTVGLHIVSVLKVRTLIIVHKEFLMKQWEKRIRQFLPGARIGKIQGKTVDIEDKDIVMVMLQSLSTKEYHFKNMNQFGLTIIDETHHVCAQTFSNALFKVQTKYILGLSATLQRKDGLTHVLHWFLGDIAFSVERENQTNITVRKIQYTHKTYKDEKFPLNKLNRPNMPEAINVLTRMQDRNNLIYTEVERCLKDGRKILILTDRRNHCIEINEELNAKLIYSGLYIGGMKHEQLDANEKCDVIIATYSLANEGLDIPSLDTVLFATPKSDIVQSSGRIMRETPGKKNNPLIIDIVDAWSLFKVQYYKRKVYYTNTGFHINIECVNN
jgi:superfamily II DNA or RNA helicase